MAVILILRLRVYDTPSNLIKFVSKFTVYKVIDVYKVYYFKAQYICFIVTFCLIIPPAYEVYRGYIVFAFSVQMLVCVFVC